ncbi:CCA-adding enzyme [Alicyclobacillus contaminans]|uniref:CCA tRNA nucleotidyltransferase n=1 Tax=Alicyclobacillus contaminans TaxID=392016 RepID=UPI0004021AA3|nr:CCA tRNA nucleotidyltransferase [Alicyclobacillus contaminans]GMA48718.1 CCA-adding enzyme [Alicyclobacillus contaminans]
MRYPWPPEVLSVLQRLESAGYEAYLVGGCVRDALLGRAVHDFDVATNAHPDAVLAAFPRVVPTGLRHGTLTVWAGEMPVEVTTYRSESTYTDGRHPDAVAFVDSLPMDLARRDFTINAMAMDLRGCVVDCHGGRRDLERRLIRAVGEPKRRFAEDGLRILRALRFAAQLTFAIEPRTWEGMQAEAGRLVHVSAERLGVEFSKMAAANWAAICDALAESRIWDYLPRPVQRLRQSWPSLRRTAAALVQCYPQEVPEADRASEMMALWCLCAGCDEAAARHVCRAIRWSNARMRLAVDFLRLLRSDVRQWDLLTWREQLLQHGAHRVLRACLLQDVLKDDEQPGTARSDVCRQYIASQPIWSARELQCSGHDLLALGVRGQRLGEIKTALLRQVLMGRLANRRDVLREAAKKLTEGRREDGDGQHPHDRDG